MSPELALAINQCVIETSAVLFKIGEKIREVYLFKSRCLKLGREARTLQHLLDTRRSAIDKLETLSEFRQCLRDIEQFVDACQNFTRVQILRDVLIRRRYASLYKRCISLREVFLLETVVEVLAREDRTTTHQQQTLADQHTILLELRERAIRDHENRNLAFGSLPIKSLDPKLFIADDIENHEGFDTSATYGRVDLRSIEMTSSTSGAFEIYKRVQTGALVQRLFGFVERKASESDQNRSNVFAVLEDLHDCITLNQAIERNLLPQLMLDRLQMAYEVAKSMAWYHRAELLLKVTSDRSIVLRTSVSSRPQCVLTGLEHARLFLEQTTKMSYDRRYDAPEYLTTLEHSRYTECWSLGTIIWQLVFKKYPYNMINAPLPQSSEASNEYQTLTSRIEAGEKPGEFDGSTVSNAIIELIKSCWHKSPLLRPTSSEIATALQTIIIDTIIEQSVEKEALLASLTENVTADSSQDISMALQQSLALVEHARKPKSSPSHLTSGLSKLPVLEFERIFDSDEWTAAKYFVVGALILWDLIEGTQTRVLHSDTFGLASTIEGRRAESALYYLESAGSLGYQQAYCETYKAHATLAREFKDKFLAIPIGNQSLLT